MSIWSNPVMLGGSGGGGSTIVSKTITANGTYNASADNANGYDPVVVNVSGGATYNIHPVSVISSGSLLFEAELDGVSNGVSGLSIVGSMGSPGVFFGSANCIFADMESGNRDQVIYAVVKSMTTGGNYQGVGSNYINGRNNAPNIFTSSSQWLASVYGSDTGTGVTSTVYHVLSISINASTKECDYYIDGVSYGTKSFSNCGRYPSIGGGTVNGTSVVSSGDMSVLYAAIAAEYHSSATVIANHQALMTRYASIIGT